MKEHLQEIEGVLKEAAKGIAKAKAAERKHFMKAVMPMLGLTVPQQRACLKTGYSFSGLPEAEQYPIWDYVWFNARTHEAKMQAGFFAYARRQGSDGAALWDLVRAWADAINCWDQSDTLSGVYAALHEAAPKTVFPTLKAWNRDADPWKRRQSLVSLFYYAQLRRRHPPVSKVLPLVRALLDDEDYYVQKGLGWTLRESFNVYPERTLAFLAKHAGDIRPAAFSAAVEKLTAEQKAAVKALRKERRGR